MANRQRAEQKGIETCLILSRLFVLFVRHLAVLLDSAEIPTNLHRAYRRDGYQNAHYALFHTDPSAAAGIAGGLVCGVQTFAR